MELQGQTEDTPQGCTPNVHVGSFPCRHWDGKGEFPTAGEREFPVCQHSTQLTSQNHVSSV